jgi:hypothetical protein
VATLTPLSLRSQPSFCPELCSSIMEPVYLVVNGVGLVLDLLNLTLDLNFLLTSSLLATLAWLLAFIYNLPHTVLVLTSLLHLGRGFLLSLLALVEAVVRFTFGGLQALGTLLYSCCSDLENLKLLGHLASHGALRSREFLNMVLNMVSNGHALLRQACDICAIAMSLVALCDQQSDQHLPYWHPELLLPGAGPVGCCNRASLEDDRHGGCFPRSQLQQCSGYGHSPVDPLPASTGAVGLSRPPSGQLCGFPPHWIGVASLRTGSNFDCVASRTNPEAGHPSSQSASCPHILPPALGGYRSAVSPSTRSGGLVQSLEPQPTTGQLAKSGQSTRSPPRWPQEGVLSQDPATGHSS